MYTSTEWPRNGRGQNHIVNLPYFTLSLGTPENTKSHVLIRPRTCNLPPPWLPLAYQRLNGLGSWERVLLLSMFYISSPLWALYLLCFQDLPWEEIAFIQTKTLRWEYDNGHENPKQLTNPTFYYYKTSVWVSPMEQIIFLILTIARRMSLRAVWGSHHKEGSLLILWLVSVPLIHRYGVGAFPQASH